MKRKTPAQSSTMRTSAEPSEATEPHDATLDLLSRQRASLVGVESPKTSSPEKPEKPEKKENFSRHLGEGDTGIGNGQ